MEAVQGHRKSWVTSFLILSRLATPGDHHLAGSIPTPAASDRGSVKCEVTGASFTPIMSNTTPDMGQPLGKGMRVKVRGAARLLMRKSRHQSASVSLAPHKAGGGQERFSGDSEVCVAGHPGLLWGQGY